MSAARPEFADIDALIARGEWWLRLFDHLFDRGLRQMDALPEPGSGPWRPIAQAVDRAARGVRLALIAVLGLERILAGLAALRQRSASEIVAEIAAARARAGAKAEAEAAARERTQEQAKARREARDAREAETVRTAIAAAETDTPERDTPERDTQACDTQAWDTQECGKADRKPEPDPRRRDRDPLVEALDKRLAAVDPAIVDFDDLQLRETVLRICADLGITPDWDRWEAGDWQAGDWQAGDWAARDRAAPDTPDTPAVAPVPAPPPKSVRPPPGVLEPPVPPGLPGSVPRLADTALSRVFQAGLDAPLSRPPRPG